MMVGANDPRLEANKQIGQAPDDLAIKVEKLEKEVKWMRWAIIFLVVYILWKDNK